MDPNYNEKIYLLPLKVNNSPTEELEAPRNQPSPLEAILRLRELIEIGDEATHNVKD